jgi:ribosomal protein S18 acetylase RimI-like enzyme
MTDTSGTLRPLLATDLQQVIDIDRAYSGRSRAGFFEKRLAAALREPQNFVFIAYEKDGKVCGYLLARLLEGEFGGNEPVAVLDGVGVADSQRGKGIGRALMSELEKILKHKKVREIQSQSEWTNQDMLRFFAASGFLLAPRYIYERDASYLDTVAVDLDDQTDIPPADQNDFSDPDADDVTALSRDLVPCRSMVKDDLPALIKIDKKIIGVDRSSYYSQKVTEVLDESGIRVSLVAEMDDHVVGFIMARVDFGEFGQAEPTAVIDTLGVDPEYTHHHVGSALLSQLMANLTVLRTDIVRTEVGASQFTLLAFLQHNGFNPAQRLSFTRPVS